MSICTAVVFLYVPLMTNDLLEAVEHAIVGVDARSLASLELSAIDGQHSHLV